MSTSSSETNLELLLKQCAQHSPPLSVEEYKSLFLEFLDQHLDQFSKIRLCIQYLDLNAKERVTLENCIKPYAFRGYLASLLLQHSTYSMNIDLCQFSWDEIDFGALSKVLQGRIFPRTFQSSQSFYDFNISLKIPELDGDKLKVLFQFMDSFDNSPHTICVKIVDSALEKTNSEILPLLINYLVKHPKISCSWPGSKLWNLEPEILTTIAEILALNSAVNISLWSTVESGLLEECKNWDEIKKMKFVNATMLIEGFKNSCSSMPLFPFTLSIKQYLEIFSKYLRKVPNHAWKIRNWLPNCKLLPNESNAELTKQFLNIQMQENSAQVSSLDLNTLGLQTKEDLEHLLAVFKQNPPSYFKTISLDITEIEFEKISLYTRLVKGIGKSVMHGFHLTLKDSRLVENNCKKISAFIESTTFPKIKLLELSNHDFSAIQDPTILVALARTISNNTHIQNLNLQNCNLGKIPFEILKRFFEILLSRKYDKLELSNNQFSALTTEQLIFIIEITFQNVTEIRLLQNKIEERGLRTLADIRNIASTFKDQLRGCQIALWNPEHFKAANAQCLQGNERFKLAEIFFYFHVDNSATSAGENPIWLSLEEIQYYELILSLIKKLPQESQNFIIGGWIRNLPFTDEHRLELISAYFGKTYFSPVFGSIKAYNLKTQDRLQLFLERMPIDTDESDMVHYLEKFDLLPSSLIHVPAAASSVTSPIASTPPLKAASLFNAWTPFHEIDEDEIQFLPEVVYDMLSKLCMACKSIWGNNDFYKESINAMMDWPVVDSFSAFKLLNMAKWFTWTAALLTTYPEQNLKDISKIFNEIRRYPDPKLRYKATFALVSKIYQHSEGPALYKSLCKKAADSMPNSLEAAALSSTAASALSSASSIVPSSALTFTVEKSSADIAAHLFIHAIFLTQIVLEDTSEGAGKIKRQELIERARVILKRIPAAYKEGLYFRPMVSAIQTIADYPAMPVDTKLNFIENAFGIEQWIQDKKQIDELLKSFINSLKSQVLKVDSAHKDEFSHCSSILMKDITSSSVAEKIEFDKMLESKAREKETSFKHLLTTIQGFSQKISTLTRSDINGSREIAIKMLFDTLFNEEQQKNCIDFLRVSLWKQTVSKSAKRTMRMLQKKANQPTKVTATKESLKGANSYSSSNNFIDPNKAAFKEESRHLIKSLQAKTKALLLTQALHAQQSNWLLLQSLDLWPNIAKYNGLRCIDFNAIAYELRIQHFALSPTQARHYDDKFSRRHNSFALFTYLNKIRMLPIAEQKPMEALFIKIIKAILSDNSEEYYALRYNEELNPHVRQLFSGRSQLKEAWKKGEKRSLKDFIKEYKIEARPFVPNYAEIFHKKIFLHNHLPAQNYQDYNNFLTARKKKDFEKCEAIEQRLKKATASINYKQKNQMVPILTLRSYVQLKLIELSNLKIDPKTQIAQLKLILSLKKAFQSALREEGREFINDLDMLLHNLRNLNTKKIEIDPMWTLVDTDDYWTTFMVGSDVPGSCQRVDGTPSLNKCLLAYVIDGKNRVLAIKDEAEITVARCILRMLWDPIAQKPVLYQEDIYPDSLSIQYRLTLTQFAKLRAQVLGLTLVSSETSEDSRKYLNSLESKEGSIALWEYVDALHSSQRDCIFTIESSQVIYSPYLKLVQTAVKEKLEERVNINQTASSKDKPVATSSTLNLDLVKVLEEICEFLTTDDNTYDLGIGFNDNIATLSAPLLFSNVQVSESSTPSSTAEIHAQHAVEDLQRPIGESCSAPPVQ